METNREKPNTVQFRIYGIVQGVGFRPTVSRHASACGVAGSVCNKGPYVEILAQGSPQALSDFRRRLSEEPPQRAVILQIREDPIPCDRAPRFDRFSIIESTHTKGAVYISPDIAVCEACRKELFDPQNRRYLHPFINCTCCGPRMTILERLPYDRERTSMRLFPMCPLCASEYRNPSSRRYDAQPVCCNECGPEVYLLEKGGPGLRGAGAITKVRRVLASGGIAAVKGIGGFHLCCDATNEGAVRLLRERKRRPRKPFAVMMRDMDAVRRACIVEAAQEKILTGHQKPILLLPKRYPEEEAIAAACDQRSDHCPAPAFIAPSVAPGNPKLGVMLPYAPVQLLLFDYPDGITMPDCLVMTSANDSGAPICHSDEEAKDELFSLSDAVLSHNRPIRIRADDTVLDWFGDAPYMIRRSRGYAPLPLLLDFFPENGPSVLGIGGELKNSFCAGTGQLFYPSPYVGDLSDVRTVAALSETAERFLDLLEITPAAVACDLHPGYQSSALAREMVQKLSEKGLAGSVRLYPVQHHYAHILSCMAENRFDGTCIGVSFDGTGYGADGTVWGGEILLCTPDDFTRVGCIKPFSHVGGDAAAREGWRIAASMISSLWQETEAGKICEALGLCSPEECRFIRRMAARSINTVTSTSAGRLFDAVSAVLGIRRQSTYEGEASTALMYAALSAANKGKDACETVSPICDKTAADPVFMATDLLFQEIVARRLSGEGAVPLAKLFHERLAAQIAEAVIRLSEARQNCRNIRTVCLSGGVFQNTLLLGLCRDRLEHAGYRVLIHRLIPPNDGGIGLGQAFYAMHRLLGKADDR